MRKYLLAAFCLAGMAPELFADYESSFRNGITAMDRRRWAEAAAAMRSAIAENPTESSKKIFIYGIRYVEYTPHFFLGVALSKTNNCSDAVAALQTSEQQGVIKRTSGYRELKQILSTCAPQEPVNARTEPARQPEVQPAQPAPAPAVPAPIPERMTVPTPPRVETSTAVSIDPALVAARRKLATLLMDARSLLDGSRTPAGAAASRDALARAINAAATATDSNSPQALQSAMNALTVASADFRRVLTAAPGETGAQLSEAVRAYIRGDYQRTAALLERAAFPSPKARAQAALFRAAARYALYTLDGGKNDSLRSQAIADLREYRRIDATQPDARLFPPPFRRLYAEIR